MPTSHCVAMSTTIRFGTGGASRRSWGHSTGGDSSTMVTAIDPLVGLKVFTGMRTEEDGKKSMMSSVSISTASSTVGAEVAIAEVAEDGERDARIVVEVVAVVAVVVVVVVKQTRLNRVKVLARGKPKKLALRNKEKQVAGAGAKGYERRQREQGEGRQQKIINRR